MLSLVGLGVVALIALLDWWTGPHLSFGVFYLLPVAACAWWGGFPPGILLATVATVLWCAVETSESPDTPPIATVWNGIARFGTLILVASLAARVHAGIIQEQFLARTDPLTRAANGRHFYEAVADAAVRARREGEPLTLAYLDLDNFKQVNDRQGHAAGDAVLSGVADAIRAALNRTGLLARLGGDEFAILIAAVGADEAGLILARVHRCVTAEAAARNWGVGLSVGAITFETPDTDVDRMVQQADAQMYAAKHAGKGRIEHTVIKSGANFPVASDGGRRAAVRVLSGRTARVRPSGADTGGEYATVRIMAPGEVGICLDRQFPIETLLVVEPLSAGARTLLARVVRSTPEGGGWAHHCALSERLGGDALVGWEGPSTPSPVQSEAPSG